MVSVICLVKNHIIIMSCYGNYVLLDTISIIKPSTSQIINSPLLQIVYNIFCDWFCCLYNVNVLMGVALHHESLPNNKIMLYLLFMLQHKVFN